MRSLIVLMVVLGLAAVTYAANKAGASPAAPKPPKPVKTPEQLEKEAADREKRLTEELLKVEAAMPDKPTVKPGKPRKLLVFTLCKGFPHDSVPLGTKTLELMGKKTGAFEATSSDDPKVFAADNLKQYDAVMMNNTTGNLFDDKDLRAALLEFVKGGKGLAGIHAATDCFYDRWPEYGEMIGGLFQGHPFRKIVVKNDDPTSPINAVFKGQGFEISDEMYTFKDPYSRDKLRILLSIDMQKTVLKDDEKRPGFKQGENRNDHDYAISWIREYGKGRVFYCSFGHDHQIFWNTPILQHYLDGIQYAMGDLTADATPTNKLKKEGASILRSGSDAVRGSAGDNEVKAAPAAAKVEPVKPAIKPPPAPWVKHPDLPAMKVGEWNDLFNGKDLSGWQTREGAWKIEDGALVAQKGADIWTTLRFGDFELELEFKHQEKAGGNSGVFLRCDKISDWLNTSFEIQVLNNYGKGSPDKHDCGALYDCVAPTKNTLTKVGEWQKFHITFKGNLLAIETNGEKTLEANLDQWTETGKNPDGSKNKFRYAYKDMAKDGMIGLQFHGDPVSYRNIKVKPLTEPKKDEEKKASK